MNREARRILGRPDLETPEGLEVWVVDQYTLQLVGDLVGTAMPARVPGIFIIFNRRKRNNGGEGIPLAG